MAHWLLVSNNATTVGTTVINHPREVSKRQTTITGRNLVFAGWLVAFVLL